MQYSQSAVVFRNSDGLEIRGILSRLTRHVAVFEVPSPLVGLRISEVLPEFNVMAEGQAVYSGRALLRSLIHAGNSLLCEAELDPAGLSLGNAVNGRQIKPGYWAGRFSSFLESWQKEYQLLPEFKSVIADMQSFLEDLRAWMDRVELEIRGGPEGDREQRERSVIDELATPVVAAIDSFVDQFENLASGLSGEAEAIHRLHLRRQLHPLLLTSPFAYRTYTKPLGYAGDYEVVDMMLRPPYEGGTMFAKLINVWLIGQAPAEAHRNRVNYLVQKLVEETARVSATGRRARIFNLGCGPADEVRRFLTEEPVSGKAALTLLDFNEETIKQLQFKLDLIKRQHRPGVELNLVRRSVQQILKDSSRISIKGSTESYDYVYCAGLFDNLADPVCQRLMDLFYSMLAPGGLLVATNVSDAMNRTRPFRYSMEYILDWHLIYRNGADFRTLAPTQAPADSVNVVSDVTGVNVFIEVRKPHHG
jgi:extracellular factor (EF) 3-hydroxypalmitic acid methyl ester biosynthesis protein